MDGPGDSVLQEMRQILERVKWSNPQRQSRRWSPGAGGGELAFHTDRELQLLEVEKVPEKMVVTAAYSVNVPNATEPCA